MINVLPEFIMFFIHSVLFTTPSKVVPSFKMQNYPRGGGGEDKGNPCEALSFVTDGYGIFNMYTDLGTCSIDTRRRVRHTHVCRRVDSEEW